MRAVVTNFGSTGDILPYLALSVELHRHGHELVVAFPPYYTSLVEQFGLAFCPVGPDLREVQNDVIVGMQTVPDSIAHMRALFAPLAAALPQMYRDLCDICRDADVLISGPSQPASRMVHETTGIPFVSSQENHFGGGGTLAFQQASASLVNPFRAQLGLPPIRNPVIGDANSPQLALYAMSRHVCPPPSHWPPHYHMTGFFFLDEEWQPDPALVEFLAAGEPPVVVTFGSMTHSDPNTLTDLILEAIRRVGCRAIIQQGWSGLAQRQLPSNVYAAGYVPHGWLFSHATCIVHHGGAGTAGAAFRAGVPSVFVPHTFDQPVWAELAYSMGYCVPPIPYLELSADRLSAAIGATLTTPRYQQVATELSEKIRAEHGVRKARLLIEQLVRKVGLHQAEAGSRAGAGRDERISHKRSYQQQQRSRRREKIALGDGQSAGRESRSAKEREDTRMS